ncbi:hypothetical protein MCOR13_007045 [Pyricularia oryzae]|nr:hypothetical protein MCOR13_007045 [Pyricularia oryzae]
MLFRNGAKSQITSALSSTGFRSKSSPREKPPTRKENLLTLNCKMSFSPDVQHTDLEVLSNSKGKRFKTFSYEMEMIPWGASPQFGL